MGTRYGQTEGPIAIISSAQNITGAWADLGSEFTLLAARSIGIYLNIDINDAQNVRLRFLGKHTSGGTDEYSLPIKTVSASDVKVEPEYFEFNNDADQKVILSVDLEGIIALGQFQVMAGTAGASPGQIDSAYVVIAY